MNNSEIEKKLRGYSPEDHEIYDNKKSSHIVFNGRSLNPEVCKEIMKFGLAVMTKNFVNPKESAMFIKIKKIYNIEESLDILYEGAAKSEFNIKLIPEHNRYDIIYSIKRRDQTSEKPLLYKEEDYMCTGNCKQPLDKNIFYDDIDNTSLLVGENASDNDN